MPPKAAAKSSAAASEAPQTYNTSDIVLAKVKGYPAWPARVVDASTANKKVMKEKPTKGKNFYLVQFFPTGDFSWAQPRDLSLLKDKEIDSFLNGSGKKNGGLMQGYQIAKNPAEWITEKEDEAEATRMYEANVEDDELASDGEQGAAAGKKGAKGKKDATKKRKRETTAANGAKKDDKKKPKKDTAKSKAGVKKDYTDDEAEPAAKKSKASAADSDAETVRGWRHKLQKIFLGKTNPPAEDMPKCAEIFDDMEKFDMKKEWLIESKLAKVLKRVALLKEDVIPDEEKYDFRKRSSDLASKWATILGGNAAGSPQAETAADNSTEAAPATENGDSAPAATEDAAPAEASSEEKKEEESAPMEVDTNGDAKPEEESKKEEEEPKKDDEAPAAVEPSA